MDKCEALMKLLLDIVESTDKKNIESNINKKEIPVGISNRHIHLSEKDMKILFGEGYKLTKTKELSQPMQYACNETVTVCGPRGAIEKVRILGPTRSKTQVEILSGDCFKLGIAQEVRLSGDLNNTPGITLIGPKGSIELTEGVIVAQRHIHMTTEEAKNFGLYDGEIVAIEFENLRGGTYGNVAIRANDYSTLECHLDIEEANAMSIKGNSTIKIIN